MFKGKQIKYLTETTNKLIEKAEKQDFLYSQEKCNIFQAYNHIRCLTYQMNEGDVPETDLYKLLEEIERQFEVEIASGHPKVKKAEWEAK